MTIHPNLVDHWFEWQTGADGAQPTLIAVLQTNLPTDPNDEGMDSGAFDDMIDAVRREYARVTIGGFRLTARKD